MSAEDQRRFTKSVCRLIKVAQKKGWKVSNMRKQMERR